MNKRPRVGSAFEEDPPSTPEPTSAAEAPPPEGLCPTCSSAPVCAVRAAIRSVGCEGLIAISACPAHVSNVEELPDEDDEPED